MRLEGTLDAFSLPDIFQLLSFTKKTGALHLRRSDTRGVVHFTTGSVTGANADESRHGLARRLVGAGLAPTEALAAAVERVLADPSVGVARALRDSGAVDEGTLHGLVAEHTVDAVFDLLRWPEGDFAFVVDQPNPDDLGVVLAVDEVVAEARRRLDYWQTVSRTIPSPESVLALVAVPSADPVVSREEWALLGLVDGRRTVAEIVLLTGRGEYAVVNGLAGLVDRGLVVVLSDQETDAATLLARRQELLAPLGGQPVPAAPDRPVVAAPAPAAPPGAPPGGPPGGLAHDGGRDGAAAPTEPGPSGGAPRFLVPDPGGRTVEPVRTAPPPAVPAPSAALRMETGVTPTRPEPFLPRRRPDHPEDQALNAGVVSNGVGPVVGSTAVATHPAAVPAPSIERDPSVNKSLLLRLIAGVRGL